MKAKVHKIGFAGNHLPRKCGIATFTSDLLAAIATAYPVVRSAADLLSSSPNE